MKFEKQLNTMNLNLNTNNKSKFTQYRFIWHGCKNMNIICCGLLHVKVWPALPISGPLSPWLLMMYHVWRRRRKHSCRPRLRSQNLSKCPNGGNFKCSISAHVRIPNCLFLKSISFCSFLSVCLPFQVWGVLNLYLDWT